MSTTSTYTEYGQLPTLEKDKLDNMVNGLPVPGSDDEGKVLKVVGGKLVLAEEEGGGGGVVYVPFAVTKSELTDEYIATTTASFTDVVAAIADGKALIGTVAFMGNIVFLTLRLANRPESPGILVFSGVTDMSNTPGFATAPTMMTIWFGNEGGCVVSISEWEGK